MDENKKPQIDRSKLTPEQREQLERYERETKQMQTLEDIASTSQQMVGLLGNSGGERKTLIIDHVTGHDFVQLLQKVTDAVNEFREKDDIELPDYATPVVKAINKLESQLNSLNKELPTPQVNVEAPNVTVEPARVDLSGIEKTLKTIPAEFKKAIQSIPKVDIPEVKERWDEALDLLQSIDTGTRMVPQFPSTLKVTNPDGSPIAGGGGGTSNPNGQATMAASAPVVIASNQSSVQTQLATDLPMITGTITASGQTIVASDLSGVGAVTVQISGASYSGLNVSFEATLDGTIWTPMVAQPIGNLAPAPVIVSGVLTANSTNVWNISPLLGQQQFRIRSTAFTAGTANVIIEPSAQFTQYQVNVATMPTTAVSQSGTWTVQPGNTANTTPWLMRLSPAPTPTITQVTPGTTSATIKAANTLRRALILFNGGTSICYVTYGATSSTTAFTFPLQASERVTIRGEEYSGVVSGIWAATGGTSMQVTEIV